MGKVLTHREAFKLANFAIYCEKRRWQPPEIEDGRLVLRFPRVLRNIESATLKANLTKKGNQIYDQLRHTLQVAGFNLGRTRVVFDTKTKRTSLELTTDLFNVIMCNK